MKQTRSGLAERVLNEFLRKERMKFAERIRTNAPCPGDAAQPAAGLSPHGAGLCPIYRHCGRTRPHQPVSGGNARRHGVRPLPAVGGAIWYRNGVPHWHDLSGAGRSLPRRWSLCMNGRNWWQCCESMTLCCTSCSCIWIRTPAVPTPCANGRRSRRCVRKRRPPISGSSARSNPDKPTEMLRGAGSRDRGLGKRRRTKCGLMRKKYHILIVHKKTGGATKAFPATSPVFYGSSIQCQPNHFFLSDYFHLLECSFHFGCGSQQAVLYTTIHFRKKTAWKKESGSLWR